ncbi:unnamed protein product [Trichobilharzia szidati]|nr:unnamed protein product [Trichobilharzia szidati]
MPTSMKEEIPTKTRNRNHVERQSPEENHLNDVPKVYEQVEEYSSLRTRIQQLQQSIQKNEANAKENLILFPDFVRHIVRICRAVRNPGGHMLLAGPYGCGKRSVAKLSCLISGYEVVEVSSSSDFKYPNFVEKLKTAHRNAGLKNTGTVLLLAINAVLNDTKINDKCKTSKDSPTELISAILQNGFIPNLIGRAELEEFICHENNISSDLHDKIEQRMGELLKCYESRVKYNLHVILCYCSESDKSIHRLPNISKLITYTTIDWFYNWSPEAYISIAEHMFHNSEFSFEHNVAEVVMNVHMSASKLCSDYWICLHRSVRFYPTSYIFYLKQIRRMHSMRHSEIMKQNNHLSKSLQKINNIKSSVNNLKTTLTNNRNQMHKVEKQITKLYEVLIRQKQTVENAHHHSDEVVTQLKQIKQTITEQQKAKAIQENCVTPVLTRLNNSLKNIRYTDIRLLRKFQGPPNLLMRVIDCLLILLNYPLDKIRADKQRGIFMPNSWKRSKKLIMKPNFLNLLRDYPLRRLNQEHLDLLEAYTMQNDFNTLTLRKICGGLSGLLTWVLSVCEYFSLAKKQIIPLEENISDLKRTYFPIKRKRLYADMVLQDNMELANALQEKYENLLRRKLSLEQESQRLSNRISMYHQFTEDFSEDVIKWSSQIANLKQQIIWLLGDSVYLAAFLVYCGPFNREYRSKLLNTWSHILLKYRIPHQNDLDLISTFMNSVSVDESMLEGLVMDDVSIQNAIIFVLSERIPLVIDPHEQCYQWISTVHRNALSTTTPDELTFRSILKDSVNNGCTLYIKNITSSLDPLLALLIDSNDIDRGYVDKEQQPTYSDLMHTIHEHKRKRQELFTTLMYQFSSDEDSLHTYLNPMNVLDETKKSIEIHEKQLDQMTKTKEEIEKNYEVFRSIACHGSLLFFLLLDLALLNKMYHFGVGQFITLFKSVLQSLDGQSTENNDENKMRAIIQKLTWTVWRFTLQSLFKKDRIIFTFLLALRLQIYLQDIEPNEVHTLLKAGSLLCAGDFPSKDIEWIPQAIWINLINLSKLSVFKDILRQVACSERQWYKWFNTQYPEDHPIPGFSESDLRPIHRLLLIRCWRPDRLHAASKHFIAKVLGTEFTEDIVFSVKEIYQQSTCTTPLLNILQSTGDTTSEIKQLAASMNAKLHVIPSDNDRILEIQQIIDQAQFSGDWVLLQNCHLNLKYMNNLICLFSSLSFTASDKNATSHDLKITNKNGKELNKLFRLWLTSEIHEEFPLLLLQMSLKYASDPLSEDGLCTALLCTYKQIKENNLDKCGGCEWNKMLHALSLLHYTIVKRQQYELFGWSKPYDFSFNDFRFSLQYIRNHIEQLQLSGDSKSSESFIWKYMQFMVAEIVYGGQISEEQDARVMNTLVKKFLQPDMFSDSFELAPSRIMPSLEKTTNYETFVTNLSNQNSVETLHLNPNAEIGYFASVSWRILESVEKIVLKDSDIHRHHESSGCLTDLYADNSTRFLNTTEGNSIKSPDLSDGNKLVDSLTHICYQLQSCIPAILSTKNYEQNVDPLVIFMLRECSQMNKLIKLLSDDVQELLDILQGHKVMNKYADKMLNEIYETKVPEIWIKMSWKSVALASWFRELLDRHNQLSTWLSRGKLNSYRMTGFFNPRGFLITIKQEALHKHFQELSLNDLNLRCQVTQLFLEDVKENPAKGIYIHGLCLIGASWDIQSGCLVEAKYKQLGHLLPLIHLTVHNADDKDVSNVIHTIQSTISSSLSKGYLTKSNSIKSGIIKKNSQDIKATNRKMEIENAQFITPVFKTTSRLNTDYITSLSLKCSKTPDNWILRGVIITGDIM